MKQLAKILQPHITKDMENQNYEDFAQNAVYVGNGVYMWRRQYSTCTRELFLMGIACIDLKLNQLILDYENENSTSIRH